MSGRGLVLIVEDDPNDVDLLRAAFDELPPPHPLRVVGDGRQAMEYLRGTGPYQDRTAHPFPALMLLDLKLPVATGFQVLAWLGERPELRARLKVVALTSLVLPDTGPRVRALGADELLEKPLQFETLKEHIERIKRLWLNGAPH